MARRVQCGEAVCGISRPVGSSRPFIGADGEQMAYTNWMDAPADACLPPVYAVYLSMVAMQENALFAGGWNTGSSGSLLIGTVCQIG